ncbi:MAG: hypothetical protein OFPI_08250 [Osedax symbiont Rs2]|nr:MAG: hypothetical protein OFPI_08250 [Osedax symbiont Rs2]
MTTRINQVLIAAKNQIVLQDNTVKLSACIGISVYPDNSDNAERLLYFAEVAKGKAKDEGKNAFRFFSDEMDIAAHKRAKVERLLQYAIINNEFSLYFQPLIDFRTSLPMGAEVLLRWTNPELGAISPEYFIPIAESTGLIYEIGAWVIEQSINHFEEIRELPFFDENIKFRIAINASAMQFKNNDLYQLLQSAIDSARIYPQQIEIEITEGLLLEDTEEVRKQFQLISELGISLSIDDFGTGYSSLSYLKRCPIKTVKIDRSFVSGIPEVKEDKILVRTIIAMAHGLEFDVIAEGIETKAQLDYLKAEGCEVGQGYYISKPIPFDQFKIWLSEHLN